MPQPVFPADPGAGVAGPGLLPGARVARALARHGVEVIFAQSQPAPILQAAEALGIRQLAYRTENAGGTMADGYARISGRVGVIAAQNGPAATLIVPPLAEALKASIPLVALVQEVPAAFADRQAFQELDHHALFSGVAKWVRRLPNTDRIEDYVDQAVIQATTGRPGPAVLLCPFDLLMETTPKPPQPRRRVKMGAAPLDPVVPIPQRIEQAAAALAQAERPLVWVGGGIHTSGGVSALERLRDVAHLPIATTSMGKGAVDERHPLSMGVVGYFMGRNSRSRHLRDMVTKADVILLVGNRTNQNGTDSWTLIPEAATLIHLDIDGTQVGQAHEADLRLVGDAASTLQALVQHLEKQDLSRRLTCRDAVQVTIASARRAHGEEAAAVLTSNQSPLRPERIVAELDARQTAGDILVADASYASIWLANGITASAGQRILTPRGIAGLGWGLPLAMGAKLARPDARVWLLTGEGGFAHVWGELETLRREQLPVIILVLNNRVLAYQKHFEDLLTGQHTSAIPIGNVDHAALARACGLTGITVTQAEDIGPALDQAMASQHATIIDLDTDPDAFAPVTLFDRFWQEGVGD